MALRDLYKKHHWQVSGPTFHQLLLLFDSHQLVQGGMIDELAERIMTLGGVSLASAADLAEHTCIAPPPRGREAADAQIVRLIAALQTNIADARRNGKAAAEAGDDVTADLFVSVVLRTGQTRNWFLNAHAG